MDDESTIEQQWAALNGDQAASNLALDLSGRQYLQREQDHFGFIIVGSPDYCGDTTPGTIIEGIHIGTDRHMASDIKLRIIGPSSFAEWREHVLFNFGPLWLPTFDQYAADQHLLWIVRAIAE